MFWDKKAPQQDLAHLGVQDAQVRDTLSVAGAAEDVTDIDFTVDRRVFLEVHTGDNVVVFGNFDGRKLTLDDFGMTEEDMGELDQRQNQNDFIDFEGKFWLYRFSREMGLFTEGHSTGNGLYAWQFEEQGGKRVINVRKFEGEPFQAAIWVRVETSDITVFRGA